MHNIKSTIRAARACIGTPFIPQGRVPGAGLDCGGLIVHALRAGGSSVTDPIAYSFPPAPDLLLQYLTANNFTATTNIQRGALLLFRFQNRAQHLALASSPTTMIHAFAPAGRVVETDIGPAWLSRLLCIFTYQE